MTKPTFVIVAFEDLDVEFEGRDEDGRFIDAGDPIRVSAGTSGEVTFEASAYGTLRVRPAR